MLPLLLTSFILVRAITSFPISHSLQDQHLLSQQTLLLPNQCNDKCGELKIPFPFHLNSSCGSLSNAFQLSCVNSTALFLNISSEKYRVLEFYSDGVLVDFPGSSSSCRQYNDLNSFGFEGTDQFGVSDENVVGLYDCEDSSVCKAECEAVDLPGCDGVGRSSSSPACCYPLSDHSVWRFGDRFSVFSKFGCRGFSSWAVLRAANSGKRGVKLEWAVPKNSSNSVCASNGYIVNATAVKGGVRCLCQEGFVGDGFGNGNGCIKSCIKDTKEVYGNQCNNKQHSEKKLLIVGGILSSCLIVASFIALFCLLKRPGKSGELDTNQDNFYRDISLRKACRTRLFTYGELEAATKGFEEGQKLVEGLNGTMYAGILLDGSHIAVQKIQCENEGDLIQVLSEIEVLSSVIHQNLACLLGCCIDLPYTPLVVYEYPPNGTLKEHLHQIREPKSGLDWPKRLNIVAETASVLAFLHYETSPPIFHRDLKSGSIFLDENLSVKIAGFGLLNPRSLEKSTSFTTPRFQKNDVCDMGILLLEIIAGSNRSLDLPTQAFQKIRNGNLEEVVDPLLYYHEQRSSRCEQIENVADLATRCLLFGGDGRLGMVDVARELGHIAKDHGVDGGGSKRGPALEETFSNSSLLQMISMSPDSIYLP